MKWTQKKDFTDPICFFKFIVEEMDSKNVFLLILFVFLNLLLINWSQKMCFCWSYLFFKIYCWSFWTSKMYFWWSYISIYNSKFTLTCQNSQTKTVNLNKICKSTMTPNASKLTTELSIFFFKRKSKENQPQNNQQNKKRTRNDAKHKQIDNGAFCILFKTKTTTRNPNQKRNWIFNCCSF